MSATDPGGIAESQTAPDSNQQSAVAVSEDVKGMVERLRTFEGGVMSSLRNEAAALLQSTGEALALAQASDRTRIDWIKENMSLTERAEAAEKALEEARSSEHTNPTELQALRQAWRDMKDENNALVREISMTKTPGRPT